MSYIRVTPRVTARAHGSDRTADRHHHAASHAVTMKRRSIARSVAGLRRRARRGRRGARALAGRVDRGCSVFARRGWCVARRWCAAGRRITGVAERTVAFATRGAQSGARIDEARGRLAGAFGIGRSLGKGATRANAASVGERTAVGVGLARRRCAVPLGLRGRGWGCGIVDRGGRRRRWLLGGRGGRTGDAGSRRRRGGRVAVTAHAAGQCKGRKREGGECDDRQRGGRQREGRLRDTSGVPCAGKGHRGSIPMANRGDQGVRASHRRVLEQPLRRPCARVARF